MPKYHNESLNKEYIALGQRILNIRNLANNHTQKCNYCNNELLIFLYPKVACEVCERRDYLKQVYSDPVYYYSRIFLYRYKSKNLDLDL